MKIHIPRPNKRQSFFINLLFIFAFLDSLAMTVWTLRLRLYQGVEYFCGDPSWGLIMFVSGSGALMIIWRFERWLINK
jgi:hypothetical protein